MMKDTALVSFLGTTVAQMEIFRRAQLVGKADFRNLEALIIAALMYWGLTTVFQFFQLRLERRLSRGICARTAGVALAGQRADPEGRRESADPARPGVCEVFDRARGVEGRSTSRSRLGEVVVIFGRSGSGRARCSGASTSSRSRPPGRSSWTASRLTGGGHRTKQTQADPTAPNPHRSKSHSAPRTMLLNL